MLMTARRATTVVRLLSTSSQRRRYGLDGRPPAFSPLLKLARGIQRPLPPLYLSLSRSPPLHQHLEFVCFLRNLDHEIVRYSKFVDAAYDVTPSDRVRVLLEGAAYHVTAMVVATLSIGLPTWLASAASCAGQPL
ncbi:hypothetical protein E2562_001564 [Oryza meyeriana var. granulata]|uniref:Uncharacterized protein n=1 Tax=Oryza meyeriana var. granulata TaxID=110450 RepID=A0A6G1DDX9_9ORYZ|nr:hypothetical protein E2562_001564 [Oryza meyeriana var. granulata]